MSGFGADALRIPVTDADSATAFYERVLGAAVTNDGVQSVDLQGTGTIQLVPSDTPLASRFGRIVVTYVLDQPSEVRAVMDAARKRGARVLKPAKKALFGSFSGSFLAPNALIWKLASDKVQDTAPVAATPRPNETSLILGVAEPKVSREFYTALGSEPDRDYGNKYIDFRPSTGAVRVCLMQSPVLAKDIGLADTLEPPWSVPDKMDIGLCREFEDVSKS